MCNAFNHPPGCMCGWGGEGHLGSGGAGYPGGGSVAHPAAGTRSTWEHADQDLCFRTTCPRCGASVHFVRHNGGSAWFDDLGLPWPKHPCFDDPFGPRFRTILAEKSKCGSTSFLGLVVETIVIEPGRTGQISVKGSDGTIIRDEVETSVDLTKCVGSLVVIERLPGRGAKVHWVTRPAAMTTWDGKPIVPPWAEKCIDDLDSSSSSVRGDAKATLKRMNPEDLGGIYGLIRALQHRSFHVRCAVEEILAHLAPSAVPTLIKLRQSSHLGIETQVKALLSTVRPTVKPPHLVTKKTPHRAARPMPRKPTSTANRAAQTQLVACPICKVLVGMKRLLGHQRKVHRVGPSAPVAS